jgi:hypothetical protein
LNASAEPQRQTPSNGGSHKLPAWRATTTPAMHQPESTLALTLRWPASTFRGNKQREILKSSNGMKTFDLQAFALHGSRCMLTHFSHFSGANIATKHLQPTSIDAAAWIPGQRSGLADMLAHWTQKQRAHPRGTCERVRQRCRRMSSFLPRQLHKTTSCTWPRTSSTCSTTPS